uniref:Pyridoxamine 5'-phosphate oxidase N-terminal domain-containing protein n=1 Tax=Chromera velia CCMP2878 TaxID=1169474 RepID=A0A0G4I645_9ALVE|eukprot:Cvel_11303.t1-p1 / transcript=Cvel_11303.t1 / gene=Cvel_11303 / organism=Chromera_velia_CCMP2878 / gene_product=hypothetical protein / transcript_product=hypothetical protein / location=Cvel_scaffold706:56496-59703(+) / protein_length=260 / sequence_SO=supercontig / SO=protein_coding / is_pseudo=false
MGKTYPEIPKHIVPLLERLPLYFVASAPNDLNGHVNLSPKQHNGSFCILDGVTVAYLDLSGSGAETAAHIAENGRLTIMFCTTEEEDAPNIIRLYGKAEIVWPQEVFSAPEWKGKFPSHLLEHPGFRAVYKLHVDRVQTSCGYAVPIMSFKRHRKVLDEYSEKKGKDEMFHYQVYKNSFSIDGKKGLAQMRPGAVPVVMQEEGGFFLGIEKQKVSVTDSAGKLLSDLENFLQAYSTPICCFALGLATGAVLAKRKFASGA